MSDHAVALVEAAYQLEAEQDEWLANLANAASALFGDGLGAFAYVGDLRSSPFVPVPFGSKDAPRFVLDTLIEMHQSAPSDLLEQSYAVGWTLSDRLGDDFERQPMVKQYMRARGIEDVLCLNAFDPSGLVLAVSAARPRPIALDAADDRRFGHLVAHLTTALRLRHRLGSSQTDGEAILSPNGRVIHAEGAARSNASREQLQRAVARQEKARGKLRRTDPDGALEMWRGLVTGRWSIVDRYHHGGRRYLVAHENEPDVARSLALSRRERQVLALAALGRSVKLIAYELGLGSGTVGGYLAKARAKTGIRDRPELARWFAETLRSISTAPRSPTREER